MFRDFRRVISLGNLFNADNWSICDNLRQGQVATLLILVITVILIFTLAVVNIGQVSNYATNLSNAADSASLSLASQLGTESFQLSQSLRNSCGNSLECCAKTGLLAIFCAALAVIIAIVATIITCGSAAPLLAWASAHLLACIALGAVIGAAGGAIGGAIAGTGALQGAIQGAAIGAAIGGGLSMGAGLGVVGPGGGPTASAGIAGPGGVVVEGSVGVGAPVAGVGTAGTPGTLIAAGGAVPAGSTVIIGSVTISSTAGLGASVGASLAIGAGMYQGYVKDEMLGDAMVATASALNGLPKEERIRESTFLQALSQTIDDPNKVPDDVDSDGDGNKTELVPNFQVCWDKRITALKEPQKRNFSKAQEAAKKFLGIGYGEAQSPVRKFQSEFKNFLDTGLSRLEVEGSDGIVVELLRALKDAGYDVDLEARGFIFWKPGPTAAELKQWKSWNPLVCFTCEPPDPPLGFDELDYVIEELNTDLLSEGVTEKDGDFGAIIKTIRQMVGFLVYNWKLWVGWWFYNPEPTIGYVPNDYYHSFERLIKGDYSSSPYRLGLNGWINEIENIRRKLPICAAGCVKYTTDAEGNTYDECIVGATKSAVCTTDSEGAETCSDTSCTCCIDPSTSLPCQQLPWDPNFATLDLDCQDEFRTAQAAISGFIPHIGEFREACRASYEEMAGLMQPAEGDIFLGCGLSGINPVTYSWQDSRCVGDSGKCHSISVGISEFKVPSIIEVESGNWLKGKKCMKLIDHTQTVDVKISRNDPADVNVSILGKWNPSSGGKIERSSKAKFSGLAAIGGYVRLEE